MNYLLQQNDLLPKDIHFKINISEETDLDNLFSFFTNKIFNNLSDDYFVSLNIINYSSYDNNNILNFFTSFDLVKKIKLESIYNNNDMKTKSFNKDKIEYIINISDSDNLEKFISLSEEELNFYKFIIFIDNFSINQLKLIPDLPNIIFDINNCNFNNILKFLQLVGSFSNAVFKRIKTYNENLLENSQEIIISINSDGMITYADYNSETNIDINNYNFLLHALYLEQAKEKYLNNTRYFQDGFLNFYNNLENVEKKYLDKYFSEDNFSKENIQYQSTKEFYKL